MRTGIWFKVMMQCVERIDIFTWHMQKRGKGEGKGESPGQGEVEGNSEQVESNTDMLVLL